MRYGPGGVALPQADRGSLEVAVKFAFELAGGLGGGEGIDDVDGRSELQPCVHSVFGRLSGDDEPGREMIDFHCQAEIGRRYAGNNELSVVFSDGFAQA
jgi:hypothetical protein